MKESHLVELEFRQDTVEWPTEIGAGASQWSAIEKAREEVMERRKDLFDFRRGRVLS